MIDKLFYFCPTSKKMYLKRKSGNIFLLFLLMTVLFSSCSINKYIAKNEHLINNYSLRFVHPDPHVEAGDLRSFIQPKPNKKILLLNVKVWAYYKNLYHPSKINNWLNKNIGEPPVLYYEGDAKKSARKMQRYLADVGFIHSNVTFKTAFKKKRANVAFVVDLPKPYRLDTIRYDIPDTLIRRFIFKNLNQSLIKKGAIYNAYTLDDERDRITESLRNSGYYYFNRNYIQFVVDSNLNNHKIDLVLHIFDMSGPLGNNTQPHIRYFIKKVYVIPNDNPLIESYDTLQHLIRFPNDTASYRYFFVRSSHPMFLPSTFDQTIKIKPGKPYSVHDVQQTYRRLFNFSILSTANILFDTAGAGGDRLQHVHFMNSHIEMQTAKLNRFSIEAVGTNSSGDLGVRGNLVYMNKNLFKRAEILRLTLLGGFEAQRISGITDSTGQASNSALFNTFETGFDASLYFPRFVSPLKLNRFNLRFNPQTNINIGFNYQLRPYYSRNIFNIGVGYSWAKGKFIKHLFTPVNINYVNVNPTIAFEKILQSETNQRLKEQYSSHMIFGLKYSFIYNNQNANRIGHFNYLRINMESSGNLLYGFDALLHAAKNAVGYYRFLGVKYAQYMRFDFDYRHYYYFSENGDILAFRAIIGSGIPYLNAAEMPYEKGFYAGGANGMRGWRFRTLGPGGYQGTSNYERVGDIQLEGNIEYRFAIYKYLKNALFMDIGNIWTYNESTSFPNGSFRFNRFYKQLALDAGWGLRLDFSYFIFRFDLAVPLVNPAYNQGSRLRINFLQLKDIVGNFGIGYPF